MHPAEHFEDLPGAELVVPGLSDLAAGRKTPEAMLVAAGSARLRDSGVEVRGEIPEQPEHELYRLLAEELGNAAHSRYNAMIGRLVSFNRALDRSRSLCSEADEVARHRG